MSFGLNGKFIENPLRFLERNLIVNSALEPFIAQRIFVRRRELTFVKRRIEGRKAKAVFVEGDGQLPARKFGVVELNRYCLEENPNAVIRRRRKSHPLQSTYLGYNPRGVATVHLDNESDFMFNHSLTGCTLAIAKDEQGTSVMHIADALPEERKEAYKNEFFGDRHVYLFQEEEYEIAEFTHVIGVNTEERGWRFFAQGYDTATAYRATHMYVQPPRDADYVCYFCVKEIAV
ncbi:MAG: hypothetical protein V7727_05580 [Sneathiella sp.]